jgi:hypothetical protein
MQMVSLPTLLTGFAGHFLDEILRARSILGQRLQ